MNALAALALIQAPVPLADLPFTYEPGRILVEARLNGEPVLALIDTGAEESFADADAALKVGGKKVSEVQASTISEQSTPAWRAQGLGLSFEGTTVRHVIPYALDLPKVERKAPWVVLGSDFIKRYVVEIDYVMRRLRLYDQATYVPPSTHATLALRFIGRYATFKGRITMPGMKERPIDIMFDSGSSLGLVLSNRLVRQEGLAERFADAPRTTKPGGPTGTFESATVKGAVGGFASAAFKGEVVLALSEKGNLGKDAAYDALMGDQIFRQLHVILDYSRSKLYLGRRIPAS